MLLYLVRHGEADTNPQSGERELTKTGATEVQKMAQWFAKQNPPLEKIYHSDKFRAKQTAEILGNSLPSASLTERKGLTPNDDPEQTIDWVNGEKENIMIVSHMPFLPILTAQLLFGARASPCFEYKASAIICLKKNHPWHLKWAFNPSLL